MCYWLIPAPIVYIHTMGMAHFRIENKHLMWFKVGVATLLVNECTSEISMDVQCFSTSCDKTQIHCNGTTTNETAVGNFFLSEAGCGWAMLVW